MSETFSPSSAHGAAQVARPSKTSSGFVEDEKSPLDLETDDGRCNQTIKLLLDPVVGQIGQDAVLPDAVRHIFCQEAVLPWKVFQQISIFRYF